MSVVSDEKFSRLIDGIVSAPDLKRVLALAAEGVGTFLGASKALAMIYTEEPETVYAPVEWSTVNILKENDEILLKVASFLQERALRAQGSVEISNTSLNPIVHDVRQEVAELGVKSLLAVSTRYRGQPNGTLIAFQADRVRRWYEADVSILNFLAYFVGISIHNHLSAGEFRSSGVPYQQMMERGEAVLFRTHRNFVISKLGRRAQRCFGLDSQALRRGISFLDLLHPSSLQRFHELNREFSDRAEEIEMELQVLNQQTKMDVWLMARLVPLLSPEGELVGWSGFCVDITARRAAERVLEKQQRQFRALEKVSQSVSGSLEAEVIASQGLRVLCEQVEADGGICFLYPIESAGSLRLASSIGALELKGLADEELQVLQNVCSRVADKGQTLVLLESDWDREGLGELSERRKLRSAVVVPIGAPRREVLGVIAIVSGQYSRFDGDDVSLVNLAGLQLGGAARQAVAFWAYRQQTQRLAALYRLSHALSTNMSFDNVIRQSFEIMCEELRLKRLWLGLVDENGEHLVGHAAFGSGWKRKMIKASIAIGSKDSYFGKVISERKPVYLHDPGRLISSFGLPRVADLIGAEPMVFVPLLVRGSVLGLLIVQSSRMTGDLDAEEMSLLSGLAAEMAVVLFARKLEEKIVEGERMRTAGILASGIAHNFNNILQAIVGQSSLLEIQYPNDSVVQKAVGLINETSIRGSVLVQQLASLTQRDLSLAQLCDVNEFLKRNRENLIGDLSPNHDLVMDFEENLPKALVEPAQLARMLSELVINAGEAMPGGGNVRINTELVNIVDNGSSKGIARGSYVRISVKDDGVGMDEETLSRCVEPFFTTKNVDKRTGLGLEGNGLGLAVAYTLARGFGGRLIIDSAPDKGTNCNLFLPVAPGQELTGDGRGK